MTETQDNTHVVAIDISTRCAWIARYFRDGRTPETEIVRFGDVEDHHKNVSGAALVAARNAKKTVNAALAPCLNGSTAYPLPEMVVMSKLILLDMTKDSSGPRRAAHWWAVVNAVRSAERLLRDKRGDDTLTIPLAEVAPMTGQYVLAGRAAPGRAGFADSTRAVKACYPKIARFSKKKGDEDHVDFRYYTVAEAIAAATVLGWSSPVRVTDAALKRLGSLENSFPVSVPSRVRDWESLNAAHDAAYTRPDRDDDAAEVESEKEIAHV